jgi:energy-coupling factor transporter ATP-binding protein EcfA2
MLPKDIISAMLTRMYVSNYKCLTNFECNFAVKQLILGANGVGKTTILDVLTLLRDFCIRGETPRDRFVGRSRTRWQNPPVPEQTFELDVSGNGGTYTLRLVIDSWGIPEQPRVIKESVSFSGQPIFRFEKGEVFLYNDQHEEKVKYPFDWYRSALATIAERRDNRKLCWFKNWLGGLLCVSPDPRKMSGVASQESKYPDQYLENFADWYRHLRQETDDHAYIKDLTEVIEGFATMRLEDAGERRREIKIRLTPLGEERDGKQMTEYLLSELSDGQRVLIALYAMLHFAVKPGATLCFDEPDNFIALGEVQAWLTRVLDRAEDVAPESQILIVSHHPELLNRMAFQDGLLLDRPDGRHTRCRRFDDASQTGLTAAELVVRGWENE